MLFNQKKDSINSIYTNTFDTSSTASVNTPTYSIISNRIGTSATTDGTGYMLSGTTLNAISINDPSISIGNNTIFSFKGKVIEVDEMLKELREEHDQLREEHKELIYMLQKVMRHYLNPSRFENLLKKFIPRLEELEVSFKKLSH